MKWTCKISWILGTIMNGYSLISVAKKKEVFLLRRVDLRNESSKHIQILRLTKQPVWTFKVFHTHANFWRKKKFQEEISYTETKQQNLFQRTWRGKYWYTTTTINTRHFLFHPRTTTTRGKQRLNLTGYSNILPLPKYRHFLNEKDKKTFQRGIIFFSARPRIHTNSNTLTA